MSKHFKMSKHCNMIQKTNMLHFMCQRLKQTLSVNKPSKIGYDVIRLTRVTLYGKMWSGAGRPTVLAGYSWPSAHSQYIDSKFYCDV